MICFWSKKGKEYFCFEPGNNVTTLAIFGNNKVPLKQPQDSASLQLLHFM